MKNHVVYLLVGQRGSGKSTFASTVKKQHPEVLFLNRDDILIEMFGSVHPDAYSGGHFVAIKELYCRFTQITANQDESKTLLECFTGSFFERQVLIRDLRANGATKVIALYFVTPVELVRQWFWQKPGIAKMGDQKKRGQDVVYYSENAPSHDFEAFHDLARKIDINGFDEVIRIDPLNPPDIFH